MHLHRTLLVALFTVLASSNALVPTKENSVSVLEQGPVTSHDGVSQGRFLRTEKTTSVNDNVSGKEASPDADERGNPILSSLKEGVESMTVSLKTTWWLEKYKPVNYVREKLVKRGTMTAAQIELRLEKYAKQLRENIMWRDIYKRNVGTYETWKRLKLSEQTKFKEVKSPDGWEKISNKDIVLELAKIKDTKEFKDYRDFAVMYDGYKIGLFGSGYYRPTVFFDKDATPLEKIARIEILLEKNVSSLYVKEFLGLWHANKATLEKNRFYQFYVKELVRLKQQGQLEKLERVAPNK